MGIWLIGVGIAVLALAALVRRSTRTEPRSRVGDLWHKGLAQGAWRTIEIVGVIVGIVGFVMTVWPDSGRNGFTVVNVAPDGYLNVRSGPASEASVIDRLKPGQQDVEIIGAPTFAEGETWVHVQGSTGERGWVNRRFLASADNLDASGTARRYLVVGVGPGERLAVHRAPSEDTAVVTTFGRTKDGIKIIETTQDSEGRIWALTTTGTDGWVRFADLAPE